MPSTIHVSTLLGSLDSDPVGRLAEALALSSEDPKRREPLKRAFTLVQHRLHSKNRQVLTVEQAKLFERVAPRPFGLLRLDQPAFIETLLVALDSRATELLRVHGPSAVLDDLDELPERVATALAAMEPGALGEFAVETAISAARSRDVSQRLERSAEAIRHRIPGLSGLEAQVKAIYHQKSTGGDECECIVFGCNGYGDCQSFCIDSWWECFLIVLGFIIILVLTA